MIRCLAVSSSRHIPLSAGDKHMRWMIKCVLLLLLDQAGCLVNPAACAVGRCYDGCVEFERQCCTCCTSQKEASVWCSGLQYRHEFVSVVTVYACMTAMLRLWLWLRYSKLMISI